MSISENNGYELINLIGLCLRLGGCEVMGQAQSCGETVSMLISGNNGYELISLIGLCLRLADRAQSCGKRS